MPTSCWRRGTSRRCARPPSSSRADIAVALAKARLGRGAEDEALNAVEGHDADFAAAGIAARVRLARRGIGAAAFAKLDGDAGGPGGPGAPSDGPLGERREAAAEALLDEIPSVPQDAREDLRRAIVGILSEADPGDAAARRLGQRLAAARY